MKNVVIAGVEYKPVTNSTMKHDIWTQAQIQRAGLDRVNIGKSESPDDFAARIFREAVTNGDVFLLLGGLLMPADADKWTVTLAEKTAVALEEVTAPEDKAAVQACVLSALTGFFVTGLASLMISPSFSSETEIDEQPTGAIAEPNTTAIGA
jgi:hypothetical protein